MQEGAEGGHGSVWYEIEGCIIAESGDCDGGIDGEFRRVDCCEGGAHDWVVMCGGVSE